MDWAMLIVTAVATVAAAMSAFVAVAQARAARTSRAEAVDARNESRAARDESVRLASEANDAFVRQAEAQERANELRVAEQTPPPWSSPRWVSGDLHALTNQSLRVIRVVEIEVHPDEAENLVTVYGDEDGLYQPGDSLEFMAAKRFMLRATKLTLTWRFEDEDAMRKLIVPL